MELLNLRPARVAALLAAPAVQALISRADALRAEVHALHPLSAEAEDRVLRKFRLDWNYHSNAIEGNSLTYGETRALLLEGVVAQGKSMKDHEDIEGHRRALDLLLEMVRNNDALRQHDVRSLHQLLLGQPFQTNAQTPDGLPTRKWVYPGQYKDQSNHVVTKTGEKHYYASVEETPALMTELTDWLAANRPTLPPLILSALFHHAFVSIHPFDDGNGRMTRLLANLVLMQAGFPPVIVRQQEREAYYAALSQADAGEPLRFVEFIGEGLERSLNIQLQGAQGDFSFEQDDLDKEIALLKASFQQDQLLEETISRPVVDKILDSFQPLFESLLAQCAKLDDLFLEKRDGIVGFRDWETEKATFIKQSDQASELVISLKQTADKWYENEAASTGYDSVKIFFAYIWGKFRGNYENPFSVERELSILFDEYKYEITVQTPNISITKLYHQPLAQHEIEMLATAFLRGAFEEIKAKTNRA